MGLLGDRAKCPSKIILESAQGLYRHPIETAEFCIIKQGKIGYLELDKLMLSISCETIKAPYSSRFQSGTS